MQIPIDLDDATLNAYVDNQLDPATRGYVLYAMQTQPGVREKISELRLVKDYLRMAYAGAKRPER